MPRRRKGFPTRRGVKPLHEQGFFIYMMSSRIIKIVAVLIVGLIATQIDSAALAIETKQQQQHSLHFNNIYLENTINSSNFSYSSIESSILNETEIQEQEAEEITTPPAPAPPPPPSQGEILSQNALAQLGISQDCTALVENALRNMGYTVGDLAPMGFTGYGYQVAPSQAQAGDIMMRDGHVAIYLGNGQAVHGGFNGMTVQSSIDASPYNYAVIVRL